MSADKNTENAMLDQAIREAKVSAGLNPDAKYPPRMFIDHLHESWHRSLWNRQLDIVLSHERADQ